MDAAGAHGVAVAAHPLKLAIEISNIGSQLGLTLFGFIIGLSKLILICGVALVRGLLSNELVGHTDGVGLLVANLFVEIYQSEITNHQRPGNRHKGGNPCRQAIRGRNQTEDVHARDPCAAEK